MGPGLVVNIHIHFFALFIAIFTRPNVCKMFLIVVKLCSEITLKSYFLLVGQCSDMKGLEVFL